VNSHAGSSISQGREGSGSPSGLSGVMLEVL
jgi:hypothetical protein